MRRRATLLSIPVKHTTGRYYAPDEALDELEAHGQIILRYADGPQPQRLARDIAGVTQPRQATSWA